MSHIDDGAASGAGTLTARRRHNLHVLLQRFVAERVNAGEAALGLEQAFAAQLQIGKSMLSQIKTSRAISDRLARQIEACCAVEAGWLDGEHASDVLTAAERQFLDEALRAYRATNAAGRRELRKRLLG